ncbi:MAG: tetratricopeptide repeat protein, partial [Acetatifactor sp.]|nr:tetratricopeptide repeat protein [Acetatifactor sp.]
MKHFFFPHDEDSGAQDILNKLVDKYILNDEEEISKKTLKAYYDVTDIIYDKRFENDEQLAKKFGILEGDQIKSENDHDENISETDKTKSYRLQTLKLLWDKIEKHYKLYTTHTDEILHSEADNAEHVNKQYNTSIKLALYHLVRGNLCLRISLCYYGVFDLDASDSWGNRGIEILWHGKNLLASLRDSSVREKRAQADLYLRLTKLNLAKYYRDYARKNRRSDFDAALAEYRQVRNRVEEEYEKVVDSTQKRQYALIWMDAVINIVKIHRRKYQVNISEREIMFLYNCLKIRMKEEDMQSFDTEQSNRQKFTIPALLNMADNVILGGKEHAAMADDSFLTQDKDLEGLTGEAFEKFNDLNSYDKKRYLLLVMLDFARIRRDLHFKDNYESAIAIAIIADQWSYRLDERIGYEPGHNIDALITISSSLRKYIKFQNISDINELLQNEKIAVTIGGSEYKLQNSPTDENKEVDFREFMKMLTDSASKGYLKSKAEVIKWHCLYQREPELLHLIEEKVASNPFKDEKTNCQLYFLEGLAALRSDKYEEAASIFKELLKQNEKEMRYIRLGTIGLKVRYLLANCYMSCAEFTKAEKILQFLHETLAVAKKSRESQEFKGSVDAKSELQEEKKEVMKESTDAEPDARVEIDLGYCYMQRGAYEEAIKIYRKLYGDGGPKAKKPCFDLENVSLARRIMGLNNYASCCIFSIY